jgi:hypothetical protein
LEGRGLLNGDHCQAIDIHRRTLQTVQHRNRKATEAMECDRAIEGRVDFKKE